MSDPALPAPAFAGFDTSAYPGDRNMTVWKSSSPYLFAGYYLTAPCHHSASWMGHRAALTGMGWNLLPVYVGQQVAGVSPCKSSILSGDQGGIDGADAVAKMASEGFPAGDYVYLDIERTDQFPRGLTDYITAWVGAIGGGNYLPGIYCHKFNASSVKAAVDAGLPDGVEARYWIVGGVASHFNIKTSKPTDVGIDFANLWQCPVSVTRAFGGVSINIDEDVADRADPAGA